VAQNQPQSATLKKTQPTRGRTLSCDPCRPTLVNSVHRVKFEGGGHQGQNEPALAASGI